MAKEPRILQHDVCRRRFELQDLFVPKKFRSLSLTPRPRGPSSPRIVQGAKQRRSASVPHKTVGLAVFASLMVSVDAFGADENSYATTNLLLDRVIVTATRTPEDESQIGSAFSQLTGQELETLARHGGAGSIRPLRPRIPARIGRMLI